MSSNCEPIRGCARLVAFAKLRPRLGFDSRRPRSSPVFGLVPEARPDDVVHRPPDQELRAPVVPDHRAGVLPHPDEPALGVDVVAVPRPPDPVHPRPAPPEPVLGHTGVLLLHAGERLLDRFGLSGHGWVLPAVLKRDSCHPRPAGGGSAAGRFARPGSAYSTGNFTLRTPASGNSFTFVGESLRVNNTNGVAGGLLYKGAGINGITTFKNLILDGGYVRHASGSGDLFRLAGKVTLASTATIDAAQGPINVSANIGGGGSLVKTGPHLLVLGGGNTYAGSTTINAGTLRLAPNAAVASYTFDNVSGSAVVNTGTGGAAMNGTLANGATVVAGGRFGNAVSLANGASVNINNGILNLGTNTSWTVSAWVRTTTPGGSILTKGDGAGWNYGNTIFYLGDGAAGGSGGIPSAVRYAGGFFQGAPGAAAVNNNAWHQVTYVNNAGDYAIYVDGVAQPLSAGNGGFSVPDIGNVVRLGVSTNTFAGDGTVNYNGLLDSVQFYRQALSPGQIAAAYQGRSVGPLPATTGVTIAAGATLDVNGVAQQIASLSGAAGSAVTLGAGHLTVGSAASTQFAGTISGNGGSLTKTGPGTLTLGARNTYTGPTTVTGGTLAFAASQRLASLAIGSGARAAVAPGAPRTLVTNSLSIAGAPGAWEGTLDLAGGAAAVDFNGGASSSPLQTIADQVRSAFRAAAEAWAGPGITSSEADASHVGVGYAESVFVLGPAGGMFGGESVDASAVLLRPALYGDADLDGAVGADDLLTLRRNLGRRGANALWQNGDFDYDGRIGARDLALLRGNFGATLPAAAPSAELLAIVPEPAAATTLAPLAFLALRRRRKSR